MCTKYLRVRLQKYMTEFFSLIFPLNYSNPSDETLACMFVCVRSLVITLQAFLGTVEMAWDYYMLNLQLFP